MNQLIGSNANHITSTSDDGVLLGQPCTLVRVIVSKAEAGKKLEIFDDTTDSSPTGKKAEIDLGTIQSPEFNLSMRKGLVAITDQTSAKVTIVWG